MQYSLCAYTMAPKAKVIHFTLNNKLVIWEVKPVKHKAQVFRAGSAQWDGLRTRLMCRWDTQPWRHTAEYDPTPWPQTSTLLQPGKRRGAACHTHTKARLIKETTLETLSVGEGLHCWIPRLISWSLRCTWPLQWHCGRQDSWRWATGREQKWSGCQRCPRCRNPHRGWFYSAFPFLDVSLWRRTWCWGWFQWKPVMKRERQTICTMSRRIQHQSSWIK